MFALTKLAARNLRRNLRRSLITLAAIASGLSLMVMTINMANGQYQKMIQSAVSQMSGHVVVQHPGYQADGEDTQVVLRSSQVADTIHEVLPEAKVARRIQLGGLLVSPNSSVGVGLQGIEPAVEADLHYLADKVVEGEWVTDGKRSLLIGELMAKALQVEIGDKVVYMGQHGGDEVESRLFRVSGIFRSGAADLDGFVAVTNLAAAQQLMPFDDPAHLVTVHLHDARDAGPGAALVRSSLDRDDVTVMDFREAHPEIQGFIAIDKASTDVIMFSLAMIVAMGVLNTVLMSVMERIREFGVMMAVGMKPARIARLVLTEGLILGVVGGAIGVVGGALLTWPLMVWGIDFSAYMGGATDMGGVTMDMKWFAQWDYLRVVQYVLACCTFTILASVYPAYYVTRLEPVEALGHH